MVGTVPVTSSSVEQQPPVNTLSGAGAPGANGTNTVTVTASAEHIMAQRAGKPPAFFKDKSQFKTWRKNIIRWKRMTPVPPEMQGDLVLMQIPEENEVREMLEQDLGDLIESNKKV